MAELLVDSCGDKANSSAVKIVPGVPLPLPTGGDPSKNTVLSSVSSSPFSSTRSNPPTKRREEEKWRSRKQRHGVRVVVINPPSAFHPDIHPPSLVRVQRALRAHSKEGVHKQLRPQARRALPVSPFRDAEGRFILQGSSGGFYVGDVLGGIPHGFGQHHIPHPVSGKMHMIYEGEWSHGTKTGFGSVFYTNGEEYIGELRENQRWGRGWMKYKDGSFFCGDWVRGRRHGIGLRYLKNGSYYHGAFCKDAQDGWGIFYWPLTKRKFEGEWVADQPYSGCYSEMESGDLEFVPGMLLPFCPKSSINPSVKDIPAKGSKIAELRLQHPILTIFNVISSLRYNRASDRDSKNLFKTQVGRKENLSASQLQMLKKLFEVMVPMVDNHAQLHVTHFRRMLLLARIEPDVDQGKKLLAHLQTCADGREQVSFNEALLMFLQFHDP
ncbi:hypothetical protein KP509_01G004600 [Ceratopteris richardii]|uniref:MORN repeat-containing protein 3 n=1 Tax=Ceratopteris richardii TaxID=49495 RepID=A0A8T2VDD4_CERRI|nr:hypothetical protein KP509_01G004600 [Ceratopteris richardii]